MEEIILNEWYPFKVWATTIAIVGPTLLLLEPVIVDHQSLSDIHKGFPIILLFVFMGAVFSLPTLALSYLSFKLIGKNKLPAFWLKIIFASISISGIFITFHLIKGETVMKLSLIYSLATIISSLLFKIYNSEKKTHAN